MTHTSTYNRREIYRRALTLAVPMMVQNGITNAVGLVDNIMVGSLGTEAITAVSIAVQLVFVYALAVFGGLSGPGIYGAQYFGSGDVEGFKNVFRLKWLIALVCLAGGAIIFFFFGENLLMLYLQGESAQINTAQTLSLAKDYLMIMLIGLVPFTITFIYASSLRETGDSIKPMVAGICSVVADIIFNYLLIFGNFGFPRLGVRGAAIATVIGRIIEMLVIVIWSHIRRNKHVFLKGIYKTLLLPKELAGRIVKKGLPIFINEFLWAAGIAALTQCYSLRGLNVVAGLNISNAICNLLNVVFVSLGSAVGILVGQMLGAAQYEKAKKSSMSLTGFVAVISLCLTLVLVLISGQFPNLYNTTADVREYSTMFIIITAVFFPVQGMLNCLYFTLRSGGKTLITFLFDSVYSWAISVPAAYALCLLSGLDILFIFAIIQALDLIKVLVGYILVRKGVWITNLVEAL